MEASQIQHGEPRRLVMSAPTPLRQDFDAPQVRGLARKTKDGPQARRLLALAAIYDGATRTEAAKIGGVGLQIIRDWVLRFNARGPDGLLDGKSTGQPSKLNDTLRQAIAGMIESGPIPAVHGVVRWRLIDLAQWIFEEFGITIAKQTLSRELRAMGYRKLSARPRHHAQAEGAIEDFKKTSPRAWRQLRARKRLTVTDRNLVRRRGPHRPEEQDHPPLGQARHPSKRTAGPTDRFHLHLRCSLPEGGQGCSPDHAGLQHRGDELAPRRDRHNRRARCPRHPPGRSSRLALVHAPPRAGQHHHHSAAAEVPRAQPGRERLAVHARQLALQPHLQILRRSRRPLLCGMEQARRSALAHHVHRTAPMGPRVLINGIWYKSVLDAHPQNGSLVHPDSPKLGSSDVLLR